MFNTIWDCKEFAYPGSLSRASCEKFDFEQIYRFVFNLNTLRKGNVFMSIVYTRDSWNHVINKHNYTYVCTREILRRAFMCVHGDPPAINLPDNINIKLSLLLSAFTRMNNRSCTSLVMFSRREQITGDTACASQHLAINQKLFCFPETSWTVRSCSSPFPSDRMNQIGRPPERTSWRENIGLFGTTAKP